MKLTVNWHGKKSTPKPKCVNPKPKIPWKLLRLPDPTEDRNAISMDEVRRQVLLMSDHGIGEALRPHPRRQSVRGDGRDAQPTHRRGTN